MNAQFTGADYASPAIRIIRICSMLLGMTLVAAAFAAMLTGIVANGADEGADSRIVGIAFGALIIGTPFVLIANIWANLYGRYRAFPAYVVAWIAMLVVAFVAVRDADSSVSTSLVLVFAAPGLIVLPIQLFLLRLAKRFANGWPFAEGRRVRGRRYSDATTGAPFIPYMPYDQTSTSNDKGDPTDRSNDAPSPGDSTPNDGGNWHAQPDATPSSDSGGGGFFFGGFSFGGGSDSGGSSSGGDSGGGGGDGGGSSS